MAKKDDVVIRFGADTSKLKRAVATAKKEISGLSESVVSFGKKFGGVFAAAGSAAVGGAIAFVTNLTQELDNLGKTASSLDLTVERLEELKFAIKSITQLSDDDVVDVMQTLQEKIGDAAREAGEARDAFKDVGLSVEDLVELSPDEVLLRTVDSLGKIENGYKQASIGGELFEDKWRDIRLLAKAGSPEIERLAEEIRAVGTATTEGAQKAAALNTSMGQLKTSMNSLAYEYGPAVIGFFTKLVQVIPGAKTASQELGLEIEDLKGKIKDLQSSENDGWLSRAIRGGRTKAEIDAEIEDIEKKLEILQKKKDELDGKTNKTSKKEQEDRLPINDALVDEEEKKDKARTKNKRVQLDEQLSDTRATVRAEGAYWQAEHDLISSLQDKNAKAVEDARERMKQAVEDMQQAGASDYRVKYYEERAGISDDEAVPSVTFSPVVDPEGLKQMPEIIQKSLNEANITVTVKPILDDNETATLNWTSSQEGHDES